MHLQRERPISLSSVKHHVEPALNNPPCSRRRSLAPWSCRYSFATTPTRLASMAMPLPLKADTCATRTCHSSCAYTHNIRFQEHTHRRWRFTRVWRDSCIHNSHRATTRSNEQALAVCHKGKSTNCTSSLMPARSVSLTTLGRPVLLALAFVASPCCPRRFASARHRATFALQTFREME